MPPLIRDRTAEAEVLRLRKTVEVLLDACSLLQDSPHPAAVLVTSTGDLAFDLTGEFLGYIRDGQAPCDALDTVWATTGRPKPEPPTQE